MGSNFLYDKCTSRWLHAGSSPGQNYYAMFDLPEEFDIDSERLSARYKQLQREWHPDKYAMRPESERDNAATMSARLNAAFDVLKAPHQRAHHLLQLRGIVPTSADGPLSQSDLSTEFLAWVMEFRERLAAAATDARQLDTLRKEFLLQKDACLSSLEAAFQENRLEDAVIDTTKLQYFTSIQYAMEDTLPR